jgi:hypothetical protein
MGVRRLGRDRFVMGIGLVEGGIALVVGREAGETVLVVGFRAEVGIVLVGWGEIGILGDRVGFGVGIGLDLVGGIAVGGMEGGWSRRSLDVGFHQMEADPVVENRRKRLVAGVEGRLRMVAVERHRRMAVVGRRMMVERRAFESRSENLGVEVENAVIEEERCRMYGMFRWVDRRLVVLSLSSLLVDYLRAENTQIRCYLLAAAVKGISMCSKNDQNFNIPGHEVHLQTFHRYSPLIHLQHSVHAVVAEHRNNSLTAENYSASSHHQISLPPERPQWTPHLRSNVHHRIHDFQTNHLQETS